MFRLQALFLASFFLSLFPLRMCLSWRTWLLWSCLTGMCLLTSRSFFQFSPIVHLAQQIQPEAGGEVICSWFCCSFTSLVMVPGVHSLSFSTFICRKNYQFKECSVQCSLCCVWLFATPWTAACQASLSISNSRSPLKLMSIELVMPSNHLILCRPLLFLPSIFPIIRVLSNELTLWIRWPKYWSFSFSISPSNEYSGLITFRID